ncbi:putative arabinose efflux permease, MFS family [Streptoalloteichus tenebrarius]|uniref:Arabinose efflux permease, MFS family n=1 Tax=Streptoalloteichus tenebrarius (strain ATCC 17920 / DSM 40477 / JCM 4838 / CBS 697.72 / NBRC 16177 / NCIMB 11028 / NRRL B-12390 / A12253. 1 / ISP 5477) TaxID=1933 RepID=A0ABT1HR62_STRSD|nr:MFS transporter [Streptoalloteichus tenebrarius]MCP2258012.1 putative arabinose efflux permease, MFS family [Streptoalloteichus tenebrarius]BFF01680.1 hypothetical protein GCM10020241_33550 [Streptoalloteichus tenebrarius]
MTGNASYRDLLRDPGLRSWLLVLLCQRFPVALAPLGILYLGQAVAGSTAFGALLVGVYAVAEAVLAGPLGRRFDRVDARRELALVLGAEGVLFGVVALGAHVLPQALVVVLVALGGAVAAGAHGGLRAIAIRLAPPSAAQPVLAVESAVSTTVWTAAPAVVAGVQVAVGPVAPTVLIAVIALLGVLASLRLRDLPAVAAASGGERAGWTTVLPACAQSFAAMLVVGAATVALPDLLPLLGVDGRWSGGWLTAMSVGGVLAGLVWGRRQWPGRAEVQSALLLALMAVFVAGVFLVPAAGIAFGLVVLVGLLETPTNAARSLAVQRGVPQRHWSMAFSAIYAAGGLGYGAAGVLVAAGLELSGPRGAVLGCTALALVVTAVAAAWELRRPSTATITEVGSA